MTNPKLSKHAVTWVVGMSAALCSLSAGCESTPDSYSPPAPDSSAGSGGTADLGDGQSSAGTENVASTAGSAGNDTAEPAVDPDNTLLDLNDDISGWTVAYAQPASLMAPDTPSVAADAGAPGNAETPDGGLPEADAAAPSAPTAAGVDETSQFVSVAHDPTAGDPVAGSMLITIPFDPEQLPPAEDPFYKVGVERQFEQVQDWSGKRALQIRARLNDGVFSSPDAPPQIKIYIRTGPVGEPGVYANLGFNLEDGARNTWQTYSFSFSAPGYVDTAAGELDLASVSTVGIEIASGAGTVVEPGTVHVDSFVLADFTN